MKYFNWILSLVIGCVSYSSSAQSILVKGDPLTKSDPNLIQFRFAPGDWQNTNNRFNVDGVIYNFYEKAGFAPLNNINGSAFYNQDWKKVTIRLNSGIDLPHQEMIYLISSQMMLWKSTDKSGKVEYKVLDANSIKAIVFEGEADEASIEFIPGLFDHEGNRFVAYFQLLSDGKAPFVKYHRRKIEYEYEYNNPAGKQSFVPLYEYYFQGPDSVWTKLSASEFKTQITRSYPALTAAIQNWFSRNSFNARKENDLLAFFSWLREQ